MCASSTHDDLARKPTLGDMNDLEGRPGLTLCMSGKSRPRNGKFRTLLLTPPGKRRRALPNAFSLLSGSEVGLKTWDLRLPPAVAKPGSNACAASHAIPVAVLSCCTHHLGPRPPRRHMALRCAAADSRVSPAADTGLDPGTAKSAAGPETATPLISLFLVPRVSHAGGAAGRAAHCAGRACLRRFWVSLQSGSRRRHQVSASQVS